MDEEEAMMAFKEQRVRYNRKRFARASPIIGGSGSRPIEKCWSQRQDDSKELQTFSIPDYISARYRRQLLKD